MLGLGFTGYLLPWDMKALFATKVGIQIAEQTPLIGPYIKTLLAGHSEIVGAQTLTRFFAIHVFFLPATSRFNGLPLHHDSQTRYFRSTIRDC